MAIRDYDDTLQWLFGQLPMFSREGASAYKPGLQTTRALSEAFGSPHRKFASIHIAGTNGKGTTAHTLASILMSAGYKVGLFTSPHLVDFRERIRVNGEMMSRADVVGFVERYRDMDLGLSPTFFELTTIMAFDYFASQQVDIAVIETGLGGRLDSTNIITPMLSVITNISLDHTQLLGDTLGAIAREKAGIIKRGVPVVIGESDAATRPVFDAIAQELEAPIVYAEEQEWFGEVTRQDVGQVYLTAIWGELSSPLSGDFQQKNMRTILTAVSLLNRAGMKISADAVRHGVAEVEALTGLRGRWTVMSRSPLVVYDTGHNLGAWQYIAQQLESMSVEKHLVVGFVSDKDVDGILDLMSTITDAKLYLCQPNIKRALDVDELSKMASVRGLKVAGTFASVAEAYKKAVADCSDGDMAFVGGSNYVVAEMLEFISRQ